MHTFQELLQIWSYDLHSRDIHRICSAISDIHCYIEDDDDLETMDEEGVMVQIVELFSIKSLDLFVSHEKTFNQLLDILQVIVDYSGDSLEHFSKNRTVSVLIGFFNDDPFNDNILLILLKLKGLINLEEKVKNIRFFRSLLLYSTQPSTEFRLHGLKIISVLFSLMGHFGFKLIKSYGMLSQLINLLNDDNSCSESKMIILTILKDIFHADESIRVLSIDEGILPVLCQAMCDQSSDVNIIAFDILLQGVSSCYAWRLNVFSESFLKTLRNLTLIFPENTTLHERFNAIEVLRLRFSRSRNIYDYFQDSGLPFLDFKFISNIGLNAKDDMIAPRDVFFYKYLSDNIYGAYFVGRFLMDLVFIQHYPCALESKIVRQNIGRELDVLQAIDHENILTIKKILLPEYNSPQALYHLPCMPIMLDQLIGMPLSFFIPIMIDLAKGLDYLHLQRICHGAITPQACIIVEGKAKWFGGGVLSLQQLVQKTDASSLLMMDYLRWQSPEVIFSASHTCRAEDDIWSLGLLFYYMVGLGLPFAACESESAIKEKNHIPLSDMIPTIFEEKFPHFSVLLKNCWLERSVRSKSSEVLEQLMHR